MSTAATSESGGLRPAGSTGSTIKYRYIDGLRGWAILLVLLIHTGFGVLAIRSLDQADTVLPDIVLPPWLRAVCDKAGHGVQLFFVVSAASLTISFLRTGTLDLRSYARRRFLRIAPMFYLGIIVYLLLYGWGPRMWAPSGIDMADVLATVLFVHAWFPNSINSVVPGGWSIGDEVSFYVLLPLLLLLLRRSRVWFVLFLLLCFVAVQIRYSSSVIGGTWSGFKVLGFINQVPVFLIGIFAGWAIHRANPEASRHRWQSAVLAPLLLVVMVVVLPQVPWRNSLIQPHILFALLAAWLCYALRDDTSALFTNRAIVSLGRVSFSVYIAHFALLAPMHTAAAALIESRGVAFLFVYFLLLLGCSYLIALATFRYIEEPFIRLGARRPVWSAKMPVRWPSADHVRSE